MSRYIGDFLAGQVVRFTFPTISDQTKLPTTPSVAPTFCVYKNSVSESTSGITVTVDFDGLAGVHRVAIDTSADPTFYVSGEDYDVICTAGVVDGVNLARVPLRSFSMENRSRKSNVIQIGGQSVLASATVTFPASIANETTVSTRATQASLDGKPTLAQIEASTLLAKEATVGNRPTLAQIEASSVLAKEATVSTRATQASLDGKPTLAQIESSTVIAKQASLLECKNAIETIQDDTQAIINTKPTLAQVEASAVLAKQSTVASTQASVNATLSGVNTLLVRVGNSVASMFNDVIAMITGGGTATAKWSANALSLAPTGGGGGSGTGARAVTLTILGDSNQPIQGASVRLSRAGETYSASTNPLGVVSFSVDDATWTVSITATGFTFTPTSLVVASNLSQTFGMSPGGITPPAPFAGLCNVLFSVIHLGNPVENASVTACLEDENPTVDNYLISRQVTHGTTDANGNCVLTMVRFAQFTRGGVYRIKVADSLGRTIHDRKVKVPDQSTANAEDLLDAR